MRANGVNEDLGLLWRDRGGFQRVAVARRVVSNYFKTGVSTNRSACNSFIRMRLMELAPRDGYKLFLRFEDGACGEVDLSSFAGCGVFAAWLTPGVFKQVILTKDGYPEWPGEIDLCPDALYMKLTGKRPEEVFPALRQLHAHA